MCSGWSVSSSLLAQGSCTPTGSPVVVLLCITVSQLPLGGRMRIEEPPVNSSPAKICARNTADSGHERSGLRVLGLE